MNDSLQRKLIIILSAFAILSALAFSVSIYILRSEIDLVFLIPCMLRIPVGGCPEGNNLSLWIPNLCFLTSVMSLFTVISIKYGANRKFRIVSWISMLLLLLIIIIALVLPNFDSLRLFSLGFPIVLLIASLYFIIYQNRKLLRISILLCLLIVAFVMKRQGTFAGMIAIIFAAGIFGIGLFMLAIRSIVTIQKNRYLSIVMFSCLFILCIINTGIILKWQNWTGGDLFMNFGSILMILVSMIVLITLPNSGFIKWSKQHKDLLLKTLVVPWVFFLVLTSMVHLLPEKTFKKIFDAETTTEIRFNMHDYEIDREERHE